MKYLIINGSPRQNGNTSFQLRHISQTFSRLNIETTTIELYGKNLSPCDDCRHCKKEPFICPVDDDMQEIYADIDSVGGIVFGSPVYWYSVTAPMEAFIDRLRPYYVNKKLDHKKAIVVLSAGSGKPDCDLTIEMFERIFKTLGMTSLGYITAEAYNEGDVNADSDCIRDIDRLLKKTSNTV